ncbi:MAG: LysR family transcriptional regulator [Pseudomonadota bacterium]
MVDETRRTQSPPWARTERAASTAAAADPTPPMQNWTEIKTAYQVGRLGTVSAAADHLGIHRATVIRHVDALEQALRAKLFHRHARGYAPTDLGVELIRAAAASEAHFRSVIGKALGGESSLSGKLIVGSLADAAYQVIPVIQRFQAECPEVNVQFIEGPEPLRLEYGEAHVAFRLGRKPQHPDYIVLPFGKIAFGLFASHDYLAAHAELAEGSERYADQRFAVLDPPGPPGMMAWLRRHAPQHRRSFETNDPRVLIRAIVSGIGIGFLPLEVAERHADKLVQLESPHRRWSTRVWVVTHVDLHRSPKVQRFLSTLRSSEPGTT